MLFYCYYFLSYIGLRKDLIYSPSPVYISVFYCKPNLLALALNIFSKDFVLSERFAPKSLYPTCTLFSLQRSAPW